MAMSAGIFTSSIHDSQLARGATTQAAQGAVAQVVQGMITEPSALGTTEAVHGATAIDGTTVATAAHGTTAAHGATAAEKKQNLSQGASMDPDAHQGAVAQAVQGTITKLSAPGTTEAAHGATAADGATAVHEATAAHGATEIQGATAAEIKKDLRQRASTDPEESDDDSFVNGSGKRSKRRIIERLLERKR